MPRLAVILIILTLAAQLHAQTFRGKVLDLVTKAPIPGATVEGRSSSSTDANGNFSLKDTNAGDTIRIIQLGYKPYIFTINALHPGLAAGRPPEISLQPISILLSEVFIKSFRNSKADSIKNRSDFASEFAYKGPGFKDIFVLKSPEEFMARHVDVHRGNNPYSASSLVKIDVLTMVGLLSKNNTTPNKLRKSLIRDEEYKYVGQAFSESRIVVLTKLTGDSLKNFMIRYRPSLTMARTMTDYDMIEYVKSKSAEFIRKSRD